MLALFFCYWSQESFHLSPFQSAIAFNIGDFAADMTELTLERESKRSIEVKTFAKAGSGRRRY